MQKKYDKYEEEFSLFGLIWFWISRWKSIVAIALIGLILGCGFAVVKTSTATTASVEPSEKSVELQITEDLKQFCEDRMNGLQQYVDSAGILSIDAYNLYRGSFSYKIDAPQENIAPIYGAFHGYIFNGELYEDMENATGLYSATDFSSIIGCSAFGVEDVAVISSGSKGSMTMSMSILAKSEEEATKLLAQLEMCMRQFTEKIQDDYAIENHVIVTSAVSEGTSAALADTQDRIRKKFTEEKEMRNNYNSVLASLQSQVGSDDTVETTLSKTTLLKYGGVGFVAGLILMLVVWGLMYLFGDKLYAVEKMEERFALKSLGTIYDTKKLNPIDRVIAQKRGSVYCGLPIEEQRAIALLNIKNELKKLSETNNVFLVSSLGEQVAEADVLKAGLEKAGYHVTGCANVIGRVDILEKMQPGDAVVVFENKERSKASLVEAELTVLKEYVDNVLGLVALGGKN